MSTVPFALQMALPGQAFAGVVGITLEPRETPPTSAKRPCEEMVEMIALALAEQVLNDAAPFETSRCTVAQTHATPTRLEYELRVEQAPPLAFAVLVSLLAQTHHAGDHLNAVRIAMVSGAVPKLGLFDLLERLPDRDHIVVGSAGAFAVETPPAWHHRPTSAIFRFRERLTPDLFGLLQRRLILWAHLAHLGGYLFDFVEQGDFDPEFGRTTHVTPMRCDFVWPDFEGWGCAYLGIRNIAWAMEPAGAALASLRVE